MLVEALSLSGFPNGATTGLDMTADFAPLFFGLWIILGLCVLGLAVATAVHDTRETKRNAKQATEPRPPFSKAA
jgi:hypothetical protein